MSDTLQKDTPTQCRKKGRRRRFGSVRTILILFLTLCIITGFMMMITPYKDYTAHKTEINQELTTFRELVAVYQEAAATAPSDPQDIPHPSMPSEPTPPEEPTVPEEPTEPEEAPTQPKYLQELWQSMLNYNEHLVVTGQSELVDAWSVKSTILDLSEFGLEDGTAGIVSIPDINVKMPLYLGATNKNLSKGFAHLSYTSLPTGGISTNCVIAGHRGYRGMPYMRDVEQLKLGDSIYIQNYWEVLEYRISEILYIDPYQTEVLKIQPGRDLLTIVTCHPYGVGSHRIILRCERYIPEIVEVPEEQESTRPSEVPEAPDLDKPQQTPDTTMPSISTGTWVWQWQERVIITSNEVGTFESSQTTIFVVEFLPWICLFLAAAVLLLTILYSIISSIVRSAKRRRAKTSRHTESNDP